MERMINGSNMFSSRVGLFVPNHLGGSEEETPCEWQSEVHVKWSNTRYAHSHAHSHVSTFQSFIGYSKIPSALLFSSECTVWVCRTQHPLRWGFSWVETGWGNGPAGQKYIRGTGHRVGHPTTPQIAGVLRWGHLITAHSADVSCRSNIQRVPQRKWIPARLDSAQPEFLFIPPHVIGYSQPSSSLLRGFNHPMM